MSTETEKLELFEIVELSFANAVKQPDLRRWKSCAQLAGVASCRMGVDGDLFRAAALEGIAEEAKRQMIALEMAA